MSAPAPEQGKFLLYTAPSGAVKIDVFFQDESVWLTQKCGNRHHWEEWANDISRIACTHILDVKKFIHPYEQLRIGFSPDAHTAAVCLQVLRAAIACLVGDRKTEQHA